MLPLAAPYMARHEQQRLRVMSNALLAAQQADAGCRACLQQSFACCSALVQRLTLALG